MLTIETKELVMGHKLRKKIKLDIIAIDLTDVRDKGDNRIYKDIFEKLESVIKK